MNTTTARITHLREQIARRALATIPTNIRILHVTRTRTVITIAYHEPGSPQPYGVDSFRALSPAEKNVEDWAPYEPRDWYLVDENGGVSADEVPGMLARAVTYARTLTT